VFERSLLIRVATEPYGRDKEAIAVIHVLNDNQALDLAQTNGLRNATLLSQDIGAGQFWTSGSGAQHFAADVEPPHRLLLRKQSMTS
jgi:hypothetical protein